MYQLCDPVFSVLMYDYYGVGSCNFVSLKLSLRKHDDLQRYACAFETLGNVGSLFYVSDDIRVVNAFDFKYAHANSSTSFWSTQFVFYLIKAYHMLHFHVKCFMSELLMTFIRLTHDSELEAMRDQKSRRQKTKGSVIRHQSLEEL